MNTSKCFSYYEAVDENGLILAQTIDLEGALRCLPVDGTIFFVTELHHRSDKRLTVVITKDLIEL